MDALAINEKLIAAGLMPEHAKAIMTAIAESVDDKKSATKADITDMAKKSDVIDMAKKSDIIGMAKKSDIIGMAKKSDITNMATKLDIAELRSELKVDIARFKTGLITLAFYAAGLIIAMVALFRLLDK